MEHWKPGHIRQSTKIYHSSNNDVQHRELIIIQKELHFPQMGKCFHTQMLSNPQHRNSKCWKKLIKRRISNMLKLYMFAPHGPFDWSYCLIRNYTIATVQKASTKALDCVQRQEADRWIMATSENWSGERSNKHNEEQLERRIRKWEGKKRDDESRNYNQQERRGEEGWRKDGMLKGSGKTGKQQDKQHEKKTK